MVIIFTQIARQEMDTVNGALMNKTILHIVIYAVQRLHAQVRVATCVIAPGVMIQTIGEWKTNTGNNTTTIINPLTTPEGRGKEL